MIHESMNIYIYTLEVLKRMWVVDDGKRWHHTHQSTKACLYVHFPSKFNVIRRLHVMYFLHKLGLQCIQISERHNFFIIGCQDYHRVQPTEIYKLILPMRLGKLQYSSVGYWQVARIFKHEGTLQQSCLWIVNLKKLSRLPLSQDVTKFFNTEQ